MLQCFRPDGRRNRFAWGKTADYVHRFLRCLCTGGIGSVANATPHSEQPEGVLAAVGHVEEAVLVLVLFVDRRHQRGCHKSIFKWEHKKQRSGNDESIAIFVQCITSWWQGVLHEDKDGLLWAKLDPLPHHIDKLANGEISRDKVSARVNKYGIMWMKKVMIQKATNKWN